jgi:hypothetical protein
MNESKERSMQELVKSIPEPTLRRLPLHYRLLKQLRDGRRAGGGH